TQGDLVEVERWYTEGRRAFLHGEGSITRGGNGGPGARGPVGAKVPASRRRQLSEGVETAAGCEGLGIRLDGQVGRQRVVEAELCRDGAPLDVRKDVAVVVGNRRTIAGDGRH